MNAMIPNDADRIWVFDYDLTLYGESERYVLNSLDKRIAMFVQKTLSVDYDEAQRKRKDYWSEYGTTLAGLRNLYGVQPNEFFDYIHEPSTLVFPRESPRKRELLLGLKGRRFVFTNARRDWSDAGLARMGIDDCFEGVLDLYGMHWEGKPYDNAYDQMEKFLQARKAFAKGDDPSRIILLEDSIKNLEPAHRRGWTTLLVTPIVKDAPAWVNYQIDELVNLPEVTDVA